MLKLRTAIGLTQLELANRLGVSRISVVKWEGGSSYPNAAHLQDLIVLAVKSQAFACGQEAEEIHALWKAAQQKMPLDEHWLSTLLDQQSCPQEQAPQQQIQSEPLEKDEGASQILPPESMILTQTKPENSLHSRGGSYDSHSLSPEIDKARGRRKRLWGVLIALVIVSLMGSLGTLFFLVREGAFIPTNKTPAYPGYLSGNGKLAFFDPLKQDSEGEWINESNNGGSCQFIGGAYHVSQQQTGILFSCASYSIFSNFAFELNLTVLHGNCGGIAFRDDRHANAYLFPVCQDGTYSIEKMSHDNSWKLQTLRHTRSSALHTGLHKQNKIAVVATGNIMTFYINERQIDQEQDSSYASGKIALIANADFSKAYATDVAYSNARVWTL
jgi:transcriptional regulator with XRE-family HTH domain